MNLSHPYQAQAFAQSVGSLCMMNLVSIHVIGGSLSGGTTQALG